MCCNTTPPTAGPRCRLFTDTHARALTLQKWAYLIVDDRQNKIV